MTASARPGGLSGQSRRELAELFGAGGRTVTVEEAAETLGVSRSLAARRLAAWASNGWLRRVRRGLYIAVPVDARNPSTWIEDPWYLADLVWSPCYIAGWSAANHWALTDQVFRSTVVATTQRVRRVDQELAGAPYRVHHIPMDRMEWGLKREWRCDRKINISNRERTAADMLSDPALGGGIRHTMEVLDAALQTSAPELLVDAVERLGNGAALKRLGFLMQTLGYDTSAVSGPLTAGYPLLDPSLDPRGSRSNTWGLVINADVSA